MSEVETWLREQLQSAVPDSLDSTGMLARVQGQARRDRRVRITAVACAALAVLAVAGAVVTDVSHPRALTPARPVSHLLCTMEAAAPAARLPLPPGPLSQNFREALVCSDRSAASVWQGNLPLDNQVSTPEGLDYLKLELPGGQRCPTMPNGPAYRLLLLDPTGQVSVVDNRRLACNGWPTLNRYFIAQGDQLAAQTQAALADPFPQCPAMPQDPLRATSGAPAALRKGTVFTAAVQCAYSLADDLATPAKEAQWFGRTVFSTEQISRLNAELARHGSTKGQVACRLNPQAVFVIHAVTATGTPFTLTGACTNSWVQYVNGAKDDTITPSTTTMRDLTQ